MIDEQFWKGKRVFVTGHTGFKGSWLSVWLNMLGADVTGYSIGLPTRPSLFEISGIGPSLNDRRGDVRNKNDLEKALIETQPDVVFHLAAQPLVRESYLSPVDTYETNVMGTVYLLDILQRVQSVRSCVIITSDKCYENREWHWGYRENEAMGGYDPYSSSKGCCELAVSSFRRSFYNHDIESKAPFISIATARAGNVIGGGDFAADRLIPDIVKSFMKKEIPVLRSPHSIRPWQHVLEPLSGYLVLAKFLYSETGYRYAEGWNFGPEDKDAKEVEWIAEKIAQLWGNGSNYTIDKGKQPHEAHYLKLDISKARALLKWKPKLTLDKALEFTVDWYKAYEQNNAADYCQKQIRMYMDV